MNSSLIDIHNHFVPGVDDGAPTIDDALRYLGEFVEQGISRVVTTPHLSARHLRSGRRAGIEAAFRELEAAVAEELPDLRLEGSYEICLDEPDADMTDPALGLSDGGALLVEFPMLMLPAFPEQMIERVTAQGWRAVLAHPERYFGIGGNPGWIPRWRAMGVLMCVNAGSLWGEYGAEAERVSHLMLAEGLVDLVASDHHARPHRATSIRSVWDLLVDAGHLEQAWLLLRDNPLAVLTGEPVAPVEPAPIATGLFGKLRRLVRRR